MAYKNPAPSSNYVNKDFQKIFPEMLDLVKKLTYKWDPSISNESDPGVILLKLNAIVSDKSNYNIDKGVLEFFPETVTQEKNAYSVFKQLGYYPKWIMSANTTVSFKYKGTDKYENTRVRIPRFTQVCDDSDSVVYTVTEKDVDLSVDGSGDVATAIATQGKINDYTINGDTRIRFSDLDTNRRLYFDELNVAQNGIFIENYGQRNYDDWKITDNVYSEQIVSADTEGGTTKYYSFGLSQDLGRCYIEFAEDVDEYIEDGISVKYLTSDGFGGNIPALAITRLKDDLQVTVNDSPLTLNTENLLIKNIDSGVNGSESQTIDEMYVGYKRVVGTFNTLVSIRDYINYILRTGAVSNGFVCDRSNDIQSTVKIVTLDNDIDVVKSVVLERQPSDPEDRDPELTAFDLRMYLNSNNTEPLDTLKSYQSTFEFVPSSSNTAKNIIRNMEKDDGTKCVLHDFQNILTSTKENPRFCGFRNKFIVKGKVVPQYTLTETQQKEILQNIYTSIFEKFNASKIEYGKEASYDDIYNTILESDYRIKTLYLNDFDYEIYGIIWRGSSLGFEEIKISSEDTCKNYIIANSILAGKTQGLDKDERFTYSLDMLINKDTDKTVQYITPVADIDWTPDNSGNVEYSITSNNENILLYSQSYNEDVTYSTYTRYDYKGSTVEANKIHKMAVGDKLIVYWRESSDSQFKSKVYEKIGDEDIYLKTNFDLTQTSSNPTVITDTDTILNSLENLGSNKEISKLSRNSITINSGIKCYWILNNKTAYQEGDKFKEKYVLFANTNEYLLMSGEYFVYTNEDETAFEVLGSGTKLERVLEQGASQSAWAVDVIKSSVLVDEGISADINWFKIPTKQELSVSAMNIQVVGSGSSIWIGNYATTHWDGNEEYQITSDSTIKIAETPVSGTVNWDDITETLEQDDWTGISILNLNMSPVEYQELKSNQKLIINNNSSDFISGSNSKYVMSSAYIDLQGSRLVDVRTYDIDNDTYSNISLMGYNVNSIGSDGGPNVSDGGTIELDDDDGSWKVTVPYNDTQSVNYSITFNNSFNSSSTQNNYGFCIVSDAADINISGATVGRANSANNSNLGGGSTFKYMSFSPNGNGSEQTTITVERRSDVNNSLSEYVIIKPLFRFDEGKITSDVGNFISDLDQHSLFDIGYNVDTDTDVEDPTEAISFFDTNHIYNQFTLPYIEDINISITNVK